LKRAEKIGVPAAKIKKAVTTSIVFTIAPAVSIIICVITLSKDLGIALPWYRLSVVGSLSYETVAASNALSGMGLKLGELAQSLTASQYVTVVFVMTLSIMCGILMVPIAGKKIQKGMIKLGEKNKEWSEIFLNALFIGMIAAFLGLIFCDVSGIFKGETKGLIPVIVMFISAALTVLCGFLMKITKWKFLNDYALPISMVLSMLSAIPLTAWLG